MKPLKYWKEFMIETALLNTIKTPVLVVYLYLLELENIEVAQFDKNRILIYSK